MNNDILDRMLEIDVKAYESTSFVEYWKRSAHIVRDYMDGFITDEDLVALVHKLETELENENEQG